MSIKIKIDIPNYSEKLKKALVQTKHEAGFKVVEKAVQNAPVDTGFYRSKIKFDNKDKVIAEAKYSAAIEFGVKARTIRPVNAKALHFKINGKDVFAKVVRQSARQPNPVMRMAAKDVQKQVTTIFLRNFKNV